MSALQAILLPVGSPIKSLSDRIARLLVEETGLVPGNRVLLHAPNGAMLFAA